MTDSPTNRLLKAIPPSTLRRLLQRDPIRLELSRMRVEHGQRIRHVYFPVDSSVSLLTPPSDECGAIEVALVGNEGMVGASFLLGIGVAPFSALVQGSGLAWQIDAKLLRDEVAASPKLRDSFGRYLYVQFVQLAQAAACTRFHVVESRLARWLLMTRDRAESPAFKVTQQLLARTLGVRRAGVTRAATSLRRRKLIRYSRGDLEITNERGLEKAACRCYAIDRATYERWLGAGRDEAVTPTRSTPRNPAMAVRRRTIDGRPPAAHEQLRRS
jgi:CRP-like cAMP-binding protein